MITHLQHSNSEIAQQIFTVFQRSYQIEADLIGIRAFPPLSRTSADIQQSTTQFYGIFEQTCLTAVIEVDVKNQLLDVCSLTVDPSHFRKGLASQLLAFVLDKFDFTRAIVETAEVNKPAINLYQGHGFVEYRHWIPHHGIPKVALAIDHNKTPGA